MKRTVSIKLLANREQASLLVKLRDEYLAVCNRIIPFAVEHRCWNRVALHHLAYSSIRSSSCLGSQMVCNALFAVCKAYKAKKISKDETVPLIQFRQHKSVHFDKRTYSIKSDCLSLYTLQGRIQVEMQLGQFQQAYLSQGTPKEAELFFKKGNWYFNLVLDLPDLPALPQTGLLGVDLGENVLVATSSGKLLGGDQVRHERHKFLSADARKLGPSGPR